MDTRAKGRAGEDIACDHLVALGYTIIDRNYQIRKGELDIIARTGDGTLVFVEVKSSTSAVCGHPFSWINRAKQRQIISMVQSYLHYKGLHTCACRLDAIAVVNGTVEHLKNAFLS